MAELALADPWKRERRQLLEPSWVLLCPTWNLQIQSPQLVKRVQQGACMVCSVLNSLGLCFPRVPEPATGMRIPCPRLHFAWTCGVPSRCAAFPQLLPPPCSSRSNGEGGGSSWHPVLTPCALGGACGLQLNSFGIKFWLCW